MELQVFTPGYGKLDADSMTDLGDIIKGFANAKYASFDKSGNQTIDPNRYTIRIDQISIMDERDGPWYGYKIIDNYGRTYHRTVSRSQVESFKARPEYWNFHTNYIYLDKTQPPHTGPLPDYLIDLAKGDYLTYNNKLMAALMGRSGAAGTAAGAAGAAAAETEPSKGGGKRRRRTLKRKAK